ncbi:hypothetical protein PARMER_00146 [Parabacteroides merdae ATCC 43184]|nr:hypothetical protein PARMER_00146 [Parabacteroides merdae ATCC 43184]
MSLWVQGRGGGTIIKLDQDETLVKMPAIFSFPSK